MKRLIQVVAAVIIVLVIGNILSRGASSTNLPADVRRVAGSPLGTSFPPQASSSEILPLAKAEPNSPQELLSPESRFEAARIRYRNIAQGLLNSLSTWEQRVQETLRKLEKFQTDWESSAGLGKNKEIGESDFDSRTGQENAMTNEMSLPTSKTSIIGGLSKPSTTSVSPDKVSEISRNTIASWNLGLQGLDKSRQAEELARQCECLAIQLFELAKQIRTNNSSQE